MQEELDLLRNEVLRFLDASTSGRDTIFTIESYKHGLWAKLSIFQANGEGVSKNAQNLTDEIILQRKLDIGGLSAELETHNTTSTPLEILS